MPELPEVETIVRGLRRTLVGRTIIDTRITGHSVFRGKSVDFPLAVNGRKVMRISRHGKAILIAFKNTPHLLFIHLGMTGQLLWCDSKIKLAKHTHLRFILDNPQKELRYVDIRRFGWLEILPKNKDFPGVDAWTGAVNDMTAALRKKTGKIKPTLLDQRVLAGMGNIYVDESLYLAGIHPLALVASLSLSQLEALCRLIKKVLAESIKLGGTSVRNYVDIRGGRGGFKDRLKVYNKKDSACVCGGRIKRIVVVGRELLSARPVSQKSQKMLEPRIKKTNT